MDQQFQGFGSDFFDFFEELKNNNNRDWFTLNKPRYQEKIVAPISAFISQMAEPLADISPHYNADPRPNGGSMFRIYRDMRFSKNGEPYKTHAGIHFRHHLGKNAHAPGYYIQLERGNIFYGAGIWTPPNDVLFKIRDRIVRNPEKWQAVTEDPALIAHFEELRGDGLKRPPRGFPDDSPHLEDIKRKSFFVFKNQSDESILSSAAFVKEVTHTFEAATPLMHFISDALEIPF